MWLCLCSCVGPLLCSEQHRWMGQHHWQVGESGRNPEWPKSEWPVCKDWQWDPLQRGKTHSFHHHSRWASTDSAEPCLPHGLINIHCMLHRNSGFYVYMYCWNLMESNSGWKYFLPILTAEMRITPSPGMEWASDASIWIAIWHVCACIWPYISFSFLALTDMHQARGVGRGQDTLSRHI